jgi:hypothetical protein
LHPPEVADRLLTRIGADGPHEHEDPFEEVEHMMRVNWVLTLSLAAGAMCAASSVLAADKDTAFTSGLQPGDKLSSFLCRGVNVPNKDKPLCYI